MADTGIGMQPEQVHELLGPFRQGSTGLARSHEGSGVGLALVQRWVGAVRGTMDVDKEARAGTTLTVRLPHNPTPPVEE